MLVAALVAGAALVASTACGASGTPTGERQPPPPAAPVSTPAPTTSESAPTSTAPESLTSSAAPREEPALTDGTPRCSASGLSGQIERGDSATGNRYTTLVVTNTSDHTCRLYGYGGLQLIGPGGNANPTNLKRNLEPGPSLVLLAPGERAGKKLHWVVVPTGGEPATGSCQPESTGATVIPPDETEPFSLVFDFGSVCAGGTLDGSAYFKR